MIDSVLSHKDLGIIFDNNLKFHEHTIEVTAKANRLLGLIKKSFDYLEPDMLVKLFVTMVRPTLEYSNSVWGPSFILDQRKLEKVQRRATRLIPTIADMQYSERLSTLQLPSLTYRRLRGDLILVYKILNGYFTSDFDNLFTYSNNITRGHSLKLFKSFSKLRCRYDYFSNRIINDWNSLPDNVVNSSTVNCFKSCIDTHLINSRFIFV